MKQYDVCLSFAGEDRAYVEAVAHALRRAKVRTFYDRYEQADVWGKDLYTHLSDVYTKRARYCVIFISKAYAKKLWTRREFKAAQARAYSEAREYILPARFDAAQMPGISRATAYVDLRTINPTALAKLIVTKIRSGRQVPLTQVLRRAIRVEFGRLSSEFHDVYVEPKIPATIARNARLRFLKSNDKLVAFVSNSYGGQDGLALLTSGIAWRNTSAEAPERLTWQELTALKIAGTADDDTIRIGRHFEVDLSGSYAFARDVARSLRTIVSTYEGIGA